MYFLYIGCRETLESTSRMADFCLGTSVDVDIGDVRGYIGLRLRFSIASAPILAFIDVSVGQKQWHEHYLVSPKLHNGSGTNQHRTRY